MELNWHTVEEYFHPDTLDKCVLVERCAVPGGWMMKNSIFEVVHVDAKRPKDWDEDLSGEWVGNLKRGTLISCQMLFYPDAHHKWSIK